MLLKPGHIASLSIPQHAELKTEKVTLPAGEYTIGVIKNGDKDWTLALYPGKLQRGDTPGHGKFEGKAVITLHFGSLFLAGVLA